MDRFERTTIKVLFPRGISPVDIEIDSFKRTCEDVVLSCIEKLRAPILLSDDPIRENEKVDIRLAFGLVKAEDESVWLPPNHVFEKNNTKQVYKFRLRHRPPSSKIYEKNNLLSEFFVLQALDDFLKGELGKEMVKEVSRDNILKLVVHALLLPSSVPLQNAKVIDANFRISSFGLLNFQKRFSKQLYNAIITTNSKLYRLADRYFYHKGLCETLDLYKSNGKTVEHYKKEFIYSLLDNYPSYCFERYTALDRDKKVDVYLVLYEESTMNEKKAGLYIGEVRHCGLEDVDRAILRQPDADDRVYFNWEVEIRCSGPKSQDKILLFDDKESAVSFITMLQGYITLCIRPDLNICTKLTSPSVVVRDNLKSFCPMVKSKAADLLLNEHTHKAPDEWCKFMIFESISGNPEIEKLFNVIDDNPTAEVQYCIRPLNGKGFQLYSESELKEFEDHIALRSYLRERCGQQLRPNLVAQTIDPMSMFYVKLKDPSPSAGEISEDGSKTSGYILEEDFGPERGLIDNCDDEQVKRSVVQIGEDKRLLVELVSRQKEYYIKAMNDGLFKMARLYRLHPSSILRFYGTVVTPTFCQSYVMEHSTYGNLFEFIRRNNKFVSTQQKMRFALEVVEIVCAMTKQESTPSIQLLHGNLRATNFWVFRRNDRYYLKLGDCGLVSYYDTQPLTRPINSARIPWLAPERQNDLTKVSIASEIYATATTIAEIFHGGKDLKAVMSQAEKDKTRRNEVGTGVTRPEGINAEPSSTGTTDEGEEGDQVPQPDYRIPLPSFDRSGEDEAVHGVKEIITKLWNTLNQCWQLDPKSRPTPVELSFHLHDLDEEASYIREETAFEHLKALVLNLHKDAGSDVKSRMENLTTMEDYQTFLTDNDPYHIKTSCVEKGDKLGTGTFGEVYRGVMKKEGGPNKDIAIKVIKDISTPAGLSEFMKEFGVCISLNHPNIVKALGWAIQRDSRHSIVMEYMNAGSLINYAKVHAILVKEKSQVQILLNIFMDIAKGMEFCEKKLVHGDLAARNVLLNKDKHDRYVAKVADFGLSKILMQDKDYVYERATKEKSLPIYWYPPEYLAFARDGFQSTGTDFTSKGDVWAYGVTLWEVFSGGRRPAEILSKPSFIHEHLYNFYIEERNRLPQPKTTRDDIYNDLMLPCWMVDKDRRPGFAEIQKKIANLQKKYI